LLEAIQNIETELRECLNRLDNECNALKPESHDSAFAQMHSFEIEKATLDKDIRTLEDQSREARRKDNEQQDLVYSLEKQTEERKQFHASEITELDSGLERDTTEIATLASKLERLRKRNAELEAAIGVLENQSHPDSREFIRSQQAQLDEEFQANMEKESQTLQIAKQKRKAILSRSQKTAAVCESVNSDIETLMAAIQNTHNYSRKFKKKTAAAALKIAEAEGEIEILKKPPTDPVLLQELMCLSQSLRIKSAKMKVSLDNLILEESELKRKIQLYAIQNRQLKGYLEPFTKIRHYYLTHRPGSVKIRSSPPAAAPARLVLECNKVDIQAT
jgi:chromosome segregation ATPase